MKSRLSLKKKDNKLRTYKRTINSSTLATISQMSFHLQVAELRHFHAGCMKAHQAYYINCLGHWAAALGVTEGNCSTEFVDFQLILKSECTEQSATGFAGQCQLTVCEGISTRVTLVTCARGLHILTGLTI